MTPSPIRTVITEEGQPYIDRPVYVLPKIESVSMIARSVSAAFNGGIARVRQPILVRYDQQRLRWVKARDKDGVKQR